MNTFTYLEIVKGFPLNSLIWEHFWTFLKNPCGKFSLPLTLCTPRFLVRLSNFYQYLFCFKIINLAWIQISWSGLGRMFIWWSSLPVGSCVSERSPHILSGTCPLPVIWHLELWAHCLQPFLTWFLFVILSVFSHGHLKILICMYSLFFCQH
jgi:hypothetical protein